jgi:hypothetical protein
MFAKVDFHILKLIMRLSYWLDYRFHWNNYLVSAWIYRFCAMCLVGGVGTTFIILDNKPAGVFAKSFICFGNLFLAMAQLRWASKMEKASQKWERDPTRIPTEAYSHILFPGWLRLTGISCGIFVGGMLGINAILGSHVVMWLGILDGIFFSWNGYDAIAMYFAAIPPSRRKRKEKKAIDWSFGLTPQPLKG